MKVCSFVSLSQYAVSFVQMPWNFCDQWRWSD